MKCNNCGSDSTLYIGDDSVEMPPNISDFWLCYDCDAISELNGFIWYRPGITFAGQEDRTNGLWKVIPRWHKYWEKHGFPFRTS